MSGRQRILTAGVCILVWLAMFFILRCMHSDYQIVDSSFTLLGLLIYVLTLFAFVEYTWLMIPNCLSNIILNIIVMADKPDRITFLVFSFYWTVVFHLFLKLVHFLENLLPTLLLVRPIKTHARSLVSHAISLQKWR